MRILWISDSPTLFSGFGTVTREVLKRLAKTGHEVASVGWAYQGWPYDRRAIPFDIYPAEPRLFGRDTAPLAIQEFRPEVVVALGDPWMIDWLKDLPRTCSFKLVVYFPVDGAPYPQEATALLRRADAAVAYSRFGQREATAACGDVVVEMIYHGVDVETFRPLADKAELRASRGLGGKFVVGCVARNQVRKQYPALAKAFARFAAEHEEAVLYLHADPKDVGWDLTALVRAYGLVERTIFSPHANTARGVDVVELNRIYNLMDVMVLPTTGEGFGLPIVEAMAAGVPVVATRCSACVELVEGRGELIEPAAWFPTGRQFIEHALPDAADLVTKLRLLYDEPERRARHVSAGLAFAQELRWENVLPEWQRLLARLAPAPAAAGSDQPPAAA